MPTIDARLRLWQLLSPALPVGAFAWSQGLEAAVAAGWVEDTEGLGEWVGGQLEGVLAAVDLPLLARLHAAAMDDDPAGFARWDALLLAMRETAELRAAERDLGASLARLLAGLEPALFDAPPRPLSLVAGHALAAARWGIGRQDALAGYAFAWCENQLTAAQRLLPVGNLDSQRLLLALAARVPATVSAALHRDDHDIGASAPGLAIASARHEVQYSRLFRS